MERLWNSHQSGGDVGLAKLLMKENAVPKHQRPYKLVGEREAAMQELVEDFLERGWLEECKDGSPWSCNAFAVPKKGEGKKFRMVIDYRDLNEGTQADNHPAPQ